MNTSKRILCLLLLFSLCFTVACTQADSKTASGTPNAATSTPNIETNTPEVPTNTPETTTQAPTQVPTQSPSLAPTKGPIDPNKKIIALSFDDGPDYNTPKMLDILAKHNVKATFFIVGRNLEYTTNQELLKKTAAAGHELANHSYSHPDLRTLSDEAFLEQISKTNNKIHELTGQTPVLFRPPSGYFTKHQQEISPVAFLLWYIDSWDWYRISAKPVQNYASQHQCTQEEAIDIISDQILFEHGLGYLDAPAGPLTERLTHGSILLFHDIHAGTAVLVDKLLTYMEQSGEYIVMPITDMLTALGTGPIPGKVYRNAWPLK